MKKILGLIVVSIVFVSIIAATPLKAKATASESTETLNSIENQTVSEEVAVTETTEDNEVNGGFTYYQKFEQLEYLVYCKGHDGTHTIVYTVNGKNETTDELKRDALNVKFGSPQFIIYYYEFINVNKGDVIEYEYSYINRYGGFPEEIKRSGTIVVE